MIVRRPSIFIYAYQADEKKIAEICAGVEEEGVFYEVFEKDDSNLENLSFEAANDSMMGTGIGFSGDNVALYMKGIEKGKYVEFYQSPTLFECRKIGANSARIIKKMPLK